MQKAGLIRVVENDQPGINVKKWFYATEVYADKPAPNTSAAPAIAKGEERLPHPGDAEEQVRKILLENPEINAATFLNLLKSQGLMIVDGKEAIKDIAEEMPKKEEPKAEADSLGANAPVLRAQQKNKDIKKSNPYGRAEEMGTRESSIRDHFIASKFLEAARDNGVGPTRFKVALIQEGLGNLRDGFYYTREALESAVTAFEGKKCFADHPSRSEENDRPERSVRDIVGHYENLHIEENEDGSAALCADLVMLPDAPFEWARSLVRHAVEYSKSFPDKEFVGLSINAAGDAKAVEVKSFLDTQIPSSCKPKIMKAMEQGLSQVRVVTTIRDAVSTDIVTEPGARGKVISLLEQQKA